MHIKIVFQNDCAEHFDPFFHGGGTLPKARQYKGRRMLVGMDGGDFRKLGEATMGIHFTVLKICTLNKGMSCLKISNI